MLRLSALVLLATSACAQTPKPDATSSDRDRRADSVVTRPSGAEVQSVELDFGGPDRPFRSVDTLRVRAGETAVGVVVHRVDRPGAPGQPAAPLFNALNLHDDEGTSVDAALAVARETGGRVVELVHTGDRNLTFAAGGRRYVADPNRMFTEAGRRRTLAALSTADPAGLDALAALADAVLAVYTEVRPPVVVTLHNNTEGRYSARSYAPGADYAGDAAAVTVHDGTDPDDFFFVTHRPLYDALVARGFNAVLQDNAAATDDGSLSVWAAREGVPYVNVEAQHGHAAEQARMIRALLDVLEDRVED